MIGEPFFGGEAGLADVDAGFAGVAIGVGRASLPAAASSSTTSALWWCAV